MSVPTYAQKLDYRYNIRGWLMRINAPSAPGTDLFAQELLYDTVRAGLANTKALSAEGWLLSLPRFFGLALDEQVDEEVDGQDDGGPAAGGHRN